MAHNLPPISKLLTNSWHTYRQRYSSLALLVLAETGISMLAFFISLGALGVIFFGPIKTIFVYFKNSNGAFPVLSFGLSILAFLILISILAIIQSWQMTALWIAVDAPETMRISNALTAGWKRMWSFLGMSVLRGLIMLAGYLFFIIPGVLFSGWFLYSDLLSARGAKPLAALKNSRALILGRWWITALYILVAYLMIFFPYEAITIIIQTIFQRFPENSFVLAGGGLTGLMVLIMYVFFANPWFLVFKKTLLDAAQNNAHTPDQTAQ